MFGASGIQPYFLLYNKLNKIVTNLNNNAFAKKMKKQILKKIMYKINTYFIKNNITNIKL